MRTLRKMEGKMKRLTRSISLAMILLVVSTGVAFAQGDGGSSGEASVSIAVLLAPLLAAATAIERIIEMGFDWYESTIRSVSKVPQEASNYLDWAKQQVKVLEDAFNKPTAATEELKKIEDRLIIARQRVEGHLKSPAYVNFKQRISLLAGIILGVTTAVVVRLGMFDLLNIPMVKGADYFITGLIIGTGSAPVHSLIGILQKTKDAIDGARAQWQTNAMKSAADIQTLLDEIAERKRREQSGRIAPADAPGQPGREAQALPAEGFEGAVPAALNSREVKCMVEILSQ
jgi:hypothetical protein